MTDYYGYGRPMDLESAKDGDNGLLRSPPFGDRITDKSARPDDTTVRDWIGPDAFKQWASLRDWIEVAYTSSPPGGSPRATS